jgi:hypothetical protein
MAQKKVNAPAAQAELYRKLLGSVEGIDPKSNFGSAYTAINGNLYTMISKHGVVGIRLPQPDRDAFLEKYETELFRGDPAWPPAKEFVAIPEDLLSNTRALKPYLKKSLEYVKTLKPKGGKKA